MYSRIVIPLDGSDLAEVALPHAEELARLYGVPLHLVRIVDFTSVARYGTYGLAITAAAYDESLASEQLAAHLYLQAVAERLGSRGLRTTTDVRKGATVRELIELVQPGDLLVMATHGRTGMKRWFLGSVAEEVTRRAPVPVLLVRADFVYAADDTDSAPRPAFVEW